MPVELNSLNTQWYGQKQADKNGDKTIDKMELAQYADKAAQKSPDKQSWEESLAGMLLHSKDGKGGETFFDIISKLDGKEGLSKEDLSMLSAKDGKAGEISGADFKALG